MVTTFLTSLGDGVRATDGTSDTYALTAPASVNADGTSFTVSLATTFVAPGTSLGYTITGISASEIVGGSLTGTLVVAADGTASASLALVADTTIKPNETMTISLNNEPAATPAIVTVIDPVAPPVPTFALKATTNAGAVPVAGVIEGNTIFVTLSTTNVAAGSMYQYTIGGISAVDLVGGSLTGTFTVDGTGNAVAALQLATGVPTTAAETLTVSLLNSTAAPVKVLVANTNPAPVASTFTLTSSAPSVIDPATGTTVMNFLLTLNHAPTAPVTFAWTTGTSPDNEYQPAGGVVTFAAGQLAANVAVTVNSIAAPSASEPVTLTFSGASLSAPVTATGTITASTPPTPQIFTVSSSAPTVTDPTTGTTVMSFLLTLNSTPTAPVTINYQTIAAGAPGAGTATAGTDYIPKADTVTFAAGQTVASVPITLIGNTTVQTGKTVGVAFSGANLTGTVDTVGTITSSNSTTSTGNTFTLTPGVDSFTGAAAGNNTFNAPDAVIGITATPTWTAGDAINGGIGPNNTFNVTQTNAISTPVGATVTNIQTANLISAAGVGTTGSGLNTTGWAGLKTLYIQDAGGSSATAAGTTAVTVIDSVAGTASESIFGGSNDTITASGVTTGAGAITIGSTTAAPTGTITATENLPNSALASATGDAITTTGGTIVNVTENIAGPSSGFGAYTSTGGVVTVNGTATTTAVTVTQSAAVPMTGSFASTSILFSAALPINDTLTINGITVTAGDASVATTLLAALFEAEAGNGSLTAATAAIVATGTSVHGSVSASSGWLGGYSATGTGSPVLFTATTPGVGSALGITGTGNSGAAFSFTAGTPGVGGIADGVVNITDANAGTTTKAGSITTVTLSNYAAGASISSNALANLSLSGTGGTVSITNALVPATATTLNLTVNNLTAPVSDTITDTDGATSPYTTLAVTTGATKSTLTGFTNFQNVTSETIAGASVLTQLAYVDTPLMT
jgi:hypothetical protein